MKQDGQFILFTRDEFKEWLLKTQFKRKITMIQQHHTYIPSYKNFNGKNHFELLKSMKTAHLQREFSDIAQNITTFNDGTIAICRPFDVAPAGIKGANSEGLCIENVGNFDIKGDKMSDEHKKTIVFLTAILCVKFKLTPNTDTIQYHHWWELDKGIRTNGTGNTKSCPGNNWYGGNTVESAQKNFIPLVIAEVNSILNPKKEVISITLQDAVKFIDSKVQIDETLWAGTDVATKAKYIDALLIKIATVWSGQK
jgi:hypothetical protein